MPDYSGSHLKKVKGELSDPKYQ